MNAVPPLDACRVNRVVVTRPAREAERWAASLQDHGWPVTVLPLIDIQPLSEPLAQALLERHRSACWHADALMFVSVAAVRHFFAQGVVAPPAGATRTRFWAPGPGTARALAQALRALGVDADRIDSPARQATQFDSEHLWPVVAPQLAPGSRVVVVRGLSVAAQAAPAEQQQSVAGSGRDWLIQRCEAAGAEVQACAAYERGPPLWSTREHDAAQAAATSGHLWLFSSSEAIAHLKQLLPSTPWGRVAALATHPRIADAARAAGFGAVIESRPAMADVLRSLESMKHHE